MRLIDDLKWRYATKLFDPQKKVSEQDIELLKEAIRLSPSSLGLQPYVIFEISDSKTRMQLREVSWGQSAITDASNLFVFCNMTNISKEYLEAFAELQRKERGSDEKSKESYLSFVTGLLSGMSPEEIQLWSSKETSLAVGIALAACAELRIDACPIGGFDPAEYNRILNLPIQNLNATLALPVGYRSADDKYQFAQKVRKPMDQLFRN